MHTLRDNNMNLHTEAGRAGKRADAKFIDSTQSSAVRAVLTPVMRDQQYGRIVNVSASIAHGWTGPVDTAGSALPDNAAAKSGILGLAAAQLAKDVGNAIDITVNAVLPWLTFGDQRFAHLFEVRSA